LKKIVNIVGEMRTQVFGAEGEYNDLQVRTTAQSHTQVHYDMGVWFKN